MQVRASRRVCYPALCRHAAAALVCRRWNRLLGSPALLRSAALRLVPGPTQPTREAAARFLPRLRAFAAWLGARAAPHLVCLHLQLCIPQGAPTGRLRRAFAELKAALAERCCGLAELRFEVDRGAKLSGWVAALAGLRTLHVRAGGKLQLVAQLQGLTSLRELHLEGCPLRIRPEAELPAGVTALALAGDARSSALPQQARPQARMPSCGRPQLAA